jgi:PKD repeat protein
MSPHPNPIYTYTSFGIHTVSLIVSDGCSFDTLIQEINIQPSSLNHLNYLKAPQIIQYGHQLEISQLQSSNTATTIEITNMLGNNVFLKTGISNQSESINTIAWSKGIYLVRVYNQQESYIKKIIID